MGTVLAWWVILTMKDEEGRHPVKLVRNLLTVDVEDYFQVASFSGVVPRGMWDEMECRIEANTHRVLDIFEAAAVRATFFVLGWVAERYPRLVADIATRGHEVASHGCDHRPLNGLSADEFREDVRKSKQILEDLTSLPVRGYRAPTFSLSPDTQWAWDILVEEGFEYDSSCFPIYHDRYGDPRGRRYVHSVGGGKTGKQLIEFPLTTLRVLGINLPAAGGGYLRLFPLGLIRAAIRQSNRRGFPAVIYFHPWELDPGQPRIQASFASRFRHYVNLGKTEGKLRALLDWADFGRVRDYVDEGEVPRGTQNNPGGSPNIAGCPLSAAIGDRHG